MDRFDELAMRLIPPGSRPAVTALRAEIAAAARRIVSESVDAFLREKLPGEIARLDAEVREKHAEVTRRLAALERERREFKRVVAGHLELLTAVERWIEWCGGNGTHDEQSRLWANVKAAWERYRKLRAPLA